MKKYIIVAMFIFSNINAQTNLVVRQNFGNSIVNVVVPYDVDGQAFIDVIGNLNDTQKNAITNLVIGLKSNGTWSKYKAIYPFVGGTNESHKWNLKDPRDLDIAYRITWVNTGSDKQSADGFTAGNTYYGDTHATPLNDLNVNDCHLSMYSAIDRTVDGGDMGVATSGEVNGFAIIMQGWGTDYSGLGDNGVRDGNETFNAPRGWYAISRTSSTTSAVSLNGNIKQRSYNSIDNNITGTIIIGGLRSTGVDIYWGGRTFGYATFGLGLTNTEIIADNVVVQEYQNALGRKSESIASVVPSI